MSSRHSEKASTEQCYTRTRARTRTTALIQDNSQNWETNYCTPKYEMRKRECTSIINTDVPLSNKRAKKSSSASEKRNLKSMESDNSSIRRTQRKKLRNKEASSDGNTTSTVEGQVQQTEMIHNPDMKNQTVTPQSSPIVVNLTPHRSTKTPRKSPISPTSPKSHTHTPLKLFKTPRKLPIIDNSPSTSEKSTISSNPGASQTESLNTSGKSLNDSVKDKRVSKSSASKRRKERRSNIKLNAAIRRFSKSPKIVIRPPKAKSKKLKSPRLKASSRKKELSSSIEIQISPKRSSRDFVPGANTKSKSARAHTVKHFSTTRAKKLAAKILGTQVTKKFTASYVAAVLSQPFVLLERLPECDSITQKTGSDVSMETSTVLKPGRTSTVHVETPPVTAASLHTTSSNKVSRSSTRKHSLTLQCDTPQRPIVSPNDTSQKRAKRMLNHINVSPSSVKKMTPTAASTPFLGPRRTSAADDMPKLSTMDGTSQIENESIPLLYDTDLMTTSNTHISDTSWKDTTYNIKNSSTSLDKTEKMDSTYEVLEPKTPDFRQKSRKRTSSQANLSPSEGNAKKSCKVHFATPVFGAAFSTSKMTPQPNKQQLNTPHSKNRAMCFRKTVYKPNIVGSTDAKREKQNKNTSMAAGDISRRRSNSITSLVTKRIALSTTKRRSNSYSDVKSTLDRASKIQQLNSVSKNIKTGIPTPVDKKTGGKPSTSKKMPNFAGIHERKFAGMESVIDAKKRVAKRHLALTSSKGLPKSAEKKVLPAANATNGDYNRFGYKLRKPEATQLLLKKQAPQPRNEKREENRTLLKGVRMNRRFELQMKSRNINI